MKVRYQKMIARRAELTAEAGAIFEAASGEDRELTEDERARDDEIQAELDSLAPEISRLERQRERQRALEAVPAASFPAAAVIEADDDEPGVSVREPNTAPEFDGTFGEFLVAVRDLANPNRVSIDPRLQHIAAASGVQQGVPSEGGLLVTPRFAAQIWDGLNQAPDNLLARTDQYTIEGESLTLHANAEKSRVTGSRYGGVRGYWIAEADQITSSKPKWRDMRLEPKELAALIYVTEKELRNATAVEQFVSRAAADELNFMIGDAIVNGNGQGKPLGIMNSNSLVTVAKESAQTAATVVGANISKMWARLHPRARAGAVWLYNVDIEPQLDAMTLTAGNELVYLPAGGGARALAENPEPRLKGRPMIPIEYCQTLGTVGDLILVDLGFYATGLRGRVREATSIHVRFEYAEQAFRFMWEIDGQPWLSSALTPFKGSNTLSSTVALATRA